MFQIQVVSIILVAGLQFFNEMLLGSMALSLALSYLIVHGIRVCQHLQHLFIL